MKQTVLSIAAVAMMAVAGPALAQSTSAAKGGAGSYGYQPPPGTPVTPDNEGRQGAVPAVGQQIQAARSLGNSDANRQPAALLQQADRALKQKKVAVANELLERAQTASLNAPNTGAGSDKMTSAIGAARQAVVDGDMARAHQQIAEALGTTPSDNTAPAAHKRRR